MWTLSPELRAVEPRLFRALSDRGARIVRRHGATVAAQSVLKIDPQSRDDVVPLHADAQVLGEMIVVPQANGGTLAERERDAIHETLRQTDGRLAQAARRLGISRTTLWRRLRAERR